MEIIEDIKKLVDKNPGQMSYEEYYFIYKTIKEIDKPNVLIFGVGKDSELWTKINKGKTLFIENDKEWINNIKSNLTGDFDIYYYQYNTKVDQWINYINNDNILILLKIKFKNREQNEILYKTLWDVILIDGPYGVNIESPGRMIPISTSYSLMWKNLFVHDIDRTVENVYSRIFFGNDFKQINRMRIYEK